MEYKKVLKSQQLRFFILKTLFFIPDSVMVRLQYWIKTGRRLNLRDPKRYTEKLQMYKIYYRNPNMPVCVDKYEVRNYLISKGFSEYLVDIYGIYENVEDICWKSLPEKFVIKTTDGGGGQNVFICKNKAKINFESLILKLKKWKNVKNINAGREWAYTGMKSSRYLIEQYLEPLNGGLIDYKFFCFNGRVEFLYVITDRDLGDKCALAVYDTSFKKLSVSRCDEKTSNQNLQKPLNFESMITIAEDLSKEFPHVRIDLYNVDGKIYFGEFTFYDGSGYMTFDPDNFDYVLGEKFDISSFYSQK